MEQHKEFLITSVAMGVVGFFALAVLLGIHPGFVATIVGTTIACGVIARIFGWKGVVGVGAMIVLSGAIGWYGFTVLFGMALPFTLYAWYTRIEDAKESATSP